MTKGRIMDAQPVLDPKIVHEIPKRVRAMQQNIMSLGSRPPAGSDSRIYDLRPWYHDYSALGLNTDFTESPSLGESVANAIRKLIGKDVITTRGSHATQKIRDKQVLPLLDKALAIHANRFGKVTSFLDTFANDGFYAFWVTKRYDVPDIICVELNSEDVRRGLAMSEVLNERRVRFVQQDVHDIDDSPVDVALCIGGLYHITDPQAFVTKLFNKANILVVHSVTTALSHDPAHIVAPAPGWHHGCRFSHEYFLAMLERPGWQVVESGFDIAPRADDEHSTGLSYALCLRKEDRPPV
jgi:hypothetical protein